MQEIQYIGENLLPGRIGHFAVVLGFISALLAMVGYAIAEQRKDAADFKGWRDIGRFSFLTHSLSVFTVLGAIFFVMVNKNYEYQYVWAHVSEDLPFKYIFSAFWEGQEGSFLLWMFWHIVLGHILMVRAGKWEATTLAVVAAVEVVINSMILGIYFGFGDEAVRIGSSPLLLLRETMDAPIFAKADYLELIEGNGLNPLLRNYWMTIHPPTLFLGFASTTIPFAFAIGGLWKGEHKAWLRPALKWALFSAAILGTGILMGAAWAYEALSFGGYWAWDPVENTSLVPWLIVIAGIHTNLVANSTGHSIRSTYVFYLLTFLLIVYSTLLTRSGWLGDTSVHAFTEMGLEAQLVAFIGIFTLLSIGMMIWRYRSIPTPKKEEALSSKEFWMFIGTLVLLFSSILITASTSLPLYNKIMSYFDPEFVGQVITDPEPHYNKYQIWIAVFIALLSGGSQWLRWRGINWGKHWKTYSLHMGIGLGGAALLTYLTLLWIDTKEVWQYSVLLFAGLFAVITNLDYLISFTRKNLKAAGSTVSHLGFGVMIVGIIASGVNKQIISSNNFVMNGLIEGDDDSELRNIMLFKDQEAFMNGYWVTYVDDTIAIDKRTYTLNFKRKNEQGDVIEEFNLHPNVLYNEDFTKIAASNPDTKHYLDKDIFTHISSLPQVEMNFQERRAKDDSLNYRELRLRPGEQTRFLDTIAIKDQDTSITRSFDVELIGIEQSPTHPDYDPEPGDLAVGLRLKVRRNDNQERFDAQPVLVLRDEMLFSYPAQLNDISTRIRLNEGIFDRIFTFEEELDYEEFKVSRGKTFTYQGLDITFEGFDRSPTNAAYSKQEGDLPVGARLNVRGPEGTQYQAEPVFLIRDNSPLNLKDEVSELGLHARFTMIDPKSEQATLYFARKDIDDRPIPFELATDSLRADYIVLQAIEFPGINFFWLGTILMMLGFVFSLTYRLRSKMA